MPLSRSLALFSLLVLSAGLRGAPKTSVLGRQGEVAHAAVHVWRANGTGHALPPKCPGDQTGPFWQSGDKWFQDRSHAVCEYSDGCQRQFSSLERVDSIRRALVATRDLLKGSGIPYMLWGGSMLGQARCGDVLPWDNDCDVGIKMSDVSRLTAGPLPNGFVLMKKSVVIPFAVVDTKSGFYCDVFQMDFVPKENGAYVAWPWGHHTCPQFPRPEDKPYTPVGCMKLPLDGVLPFRSCIMSGVEQSCPADMPKVLTVNFGPEWKAPDIETAKLL